MRPKTTPEEYLALERQAEHKSEYHDGEIFAMAGATPEHVLIVSNIVTLLNVALGDRPCVVFSTDMRLQVDPTGLYTYPDVAVACGDVRFSEDNLLNPVVLFEVLSESTQDYDRGSKFAHYRGIDSLMHYVLVAQDRIHVEHFERGDDGRWILSETDDGEAEVWLRSIDFRLKLSDVYLKLDLLQEKRP